MKFHNTKNDSGGRAAIQSNKSDMDLKQIGGEGGGKTGSIPGGSKDVSFTPARSVNTNYTGPGRNLKKES
jgi:hypothetical protein